MILISSNRYYCEDLSPTNDYGQKAEVIELRVRSYGYFFTTPYELRKILLPEYSSIDWVG
jgi:hypothetical protein